MKVYGVAGKRNHRLEVTEYFQMAEYTQANSKMTYLMIKMDKSFIPIITYIKVLYIVVLLDREYL